MIYITGDTHGEFKYRFNTENFPEQTQMTKDDHVIICGDFCGIWYTEEENKSEKYWLTWFEERTYTLLFIDGNHENFDRLNRYKEKEWHGGRVHEIRPHVLHLMRGQVFEIDGKKIFTFGGASSHDITGGILQADDPDIRKIKNSLEAERMSYRIDHLTWWKEELATEDEMKEGLANLKAHGDTVDYIITHCCATSTQNELSLDGLYSRDRETDYLECIKNSINYKKWFFGHYHDNRNVSAKEILLYEQIIRIA